MNSPRFTLYTDGDPHNSVLHDNVAGRKIPGVLALTLRLGFSKGSYARELEVHRARVDVWSDGNLGGPHFLHDEAGELVTAVDILTDFNIKPIERGK